MLSPVIRAVFTWTTRLFYREISVSGAAAPAGPLVIVANHPNGLVDPLLVRIGVREDVGFLAKSTLFENPLGEAVMEAFSAVPVYRAMDGKDTSNNTSMFDACQRRLEEGGALMLFPEGISHSEPQLQPLKTGAARIALQAEAANDFALGVQILPVGLIYDDKEVFRSRVAVVVGQPFGVTAWRGRYEEDARAASRELTHEIAEALSDVVLEAEDHELWDGFLAVAGWTDEEAARDLDVRQQRARELADGYRRLNAHDPALAHEMVDEVRHFVRMLEAVGVRDPLSIEENVPSPGRLIAYALGLLLLAPVALVGAILGWVPYRLIRPLSFALARGDLDIVSNIKAIAGLVFMPLTYVIEAALAARWWGWQVGLAVLVLAPVTGFAALRFDEVVTLRRDALRALWLRATRFSAARAIAARRQELAQRINALMETSRALEPASQLDRAGAS